MNKRELLHAIAPLVAVLFGFFGMWCGYKRRLALLLIVCMAWLVLSNWMVRR